MIKLENIKKSFGQKHVLRGVTLQIEQGETLAIIGKSGTGKSVLFKLVVGLLTPDEGTISINGRQVSQMSAKELYEVRRSIGYVFQSAALLDYMTVYENMVLGLIENGYKDEAKLEEEVKINLGNVGLIPVSGSVSLDEYSKQFQIIANKKPSELSGGMRKRVGVARALMGSPKFIFYDEPTTGLDPQTSEQIDNLINDLSQRLSATSIVITHDMFSVYKVAQRVVMLHDGLVHFVGSVAELRTSTDPIVKDFIERYNT